MMQIFCRNLIIFATLVSTLASPKTSTLPDQMRTVELLLEVSPEFTDIGKWSLKSGICRSANCLTIAWMYKLSLDKDVNPCDNFYAFTCGSWTGAINNNSDFPKLKLAGADFVSSLMDDRRRAMLRIRPNDTDILPVQQARKFYQSCMNTEYRQKIGIKPIASILERIGGWPMAMNVNDWNEMARSRQDVDEYFMSLGGDYAFYALSPITASWEPGDNMLIGWIPPNFSYNLTELKMTREKYRSILRPILEKFIDYNGANVSAAQLDEDIDDLFIFEKKLQEAKNQEASPHPITLVKRLLAFQTDLQVIRRLDNDDLTIEFQIDVARAIRSYLDDESISVHDRVPLTMHKHYFSSLINIWESTRKRTIINYIHWNFVRQFLKYTSDDMLLKISEFQPEAPSEVNYKTCFQQTQMIHAEAYWSAKNFFWTDTQKAAQRVIENVRQEVKNQISNSNWLNSYEKRVLHDRAHWLKIVTGIKDWHRDRTAIEQYYKGLTISDSDFMSNILNFRKHQRKRDTRVSLDFEKPTKWGISPLHGKVEFIPAQSYGDVHTMNIPAALLLPPSFGHKLPDYINYAVIGMTIGHQLGRALEAPHNGDEGLSDLLHLGMWDNSSQQYPCIQDHLRNYHSRNIKADGIDFHKEFPDIIGFQASLEAYKRLQENKKVNLKLKLPTFEKFSDEQMFFISFSQAWCGISANESRKDWFSLHSLSEARVNSALANSREFAEAFHCPAESPMNSRKKCSFWMKSP